MKKLFILVLLCFSLLGVTSCGCNRIGETHSALYNKNISFDFDSMDTASSDITQAIEAGIKDAMPTDMVDGHFRIERNNYTYAYEEGTTSTKVNFYTFEIDARPDENNSIVTFSGIITIDFVSEVEGETYTIQNKNNKVIEFEISNRGTCLYDEKTGNLTISIPEYKETGTITQVGQETTTTDSGYVETADPVTNTWEIDDTFNDIKISFIPHAE